MQTGYKMRYHNYFHNQRKTGEASGTAGKFQRTAAISREGQNRKHRCGIYTFYSR